MRNNPSAEGSKEGSNARNDSNTSDGLFCGFNRGKETQKEMKIGEIELEGGRGEGRESGLRF